MGVTRGVSWPPLSFSLVHTVSESSWSSRPAREVDSSDWAGTQWRLTNRNCETHTAKFTIRTILALIIIHFCSQEPDDCSHWIYMDGPR